MYNPLQCVFDDELSFSALKLDRKRLKSEKCELLNQMKEVYSALEGRERELRDFIRQYEQKMRDSDKGMRELLLEKDKVLEERSRVVTAAEEAESKLGGLRDNLRSKDDEIKKLHLQLKLFCNSTSYHKNTING